MVMLFDFQDRRFSLCQHSLKEGEESLQEVRGLERSLQRCVCVYSDLCFTGCCLIWFKFKSVKFVCVHCRCKTKLAASLARCRVKQHLQSVSCFLSDPLRSKEHRAKRLPLYVWVNTLGTRCTHAHTHYLHSEKCKYCEDLQYNYSDDKQ